MWTGRAGRPAAHALLRLPAPELLDRELETLSRFFSTRPVVYRAVGGAAAPAALGQPVEGMLFVAGEAAETQASGTGRSPAVAPRRGS